MRKTGLYDPAFEHDACGLGFVGRLNGAAGPEIIAMALSLLANLDHRGAAGADGGSGDGAGLLLAIPDAFLRRVVSFALPPAGSYGLGMVFLPRHPGLRGQAVRLIDRLAVRAGFKNPRWRAVPSHSETLGREARLSRPAIRQFFLMPQSGENKGRELEHRLYLLRKTIENEALRQGLGADDLYISSLSSRITIYKGMMTGAQLPAFYPDLTAPNLASPFGIVHQRYSTNTFPAWRLAQPFRCLAHNGEINTIRGNRAWLSAREPHLKSPVFGPDISRLFPLIDAEASDSASLDAALEFLHQNGRSLPHAMSMLMPRAWGDRYEMSPELRGFYDFHAGLMEPWDGPAAVVFTDGCSVGACVDRNGLRPARYALTEDGLVVVASEAGALELDQATLVAKGALRPGQMFWADLEKGRLRFDAEIKNALAERRPYHLWVGENRLKLPDFSAPGFAPQLEPPELTERQILFGYDRDDLEMILGPMAAAGVEPIGSMGLDIPLPFLDDRPQSLFSFFRQRFAQITNPPIDPIREELVMSLTTFIGQNPDILAEEPAQARLIKLGRPVMSPAGLAWLKGLSGREFSWAEIQAVFTLPPEEGRPGQSFKAALDGLAAEAALLARDGARIIIISDRQAGGGLLPLPSLLALAAVNRRLIESGHRAGVSLICECGDAREVDHLAMLLSLGAAAVCPWLALESVHNLSRDLPGSSARALDNYVRALCRGLLKIMSKMGISTLRGYRGAQVFEAVGLGRELMDEYFPAVPSRVGGLGLAHLEQAAVGRLRLCPARAAEKNEGAAPALPVGGTYRYRKGGEAHLWTPQTTGLLRRAAVSGDYELYKKYAAEIDEQGRKVFTLRGLLDFAPDRPPLPLAEVEPEESLMRRFVTGAMSFGSLSKEAHETLALAMNAIGGRSNCGEGGEDPARYRNSPAGGGLRSAVKQVASGRFGVTLEYLADADELQIKIAQGAKPGEGGQLPGSKVDAEIARVRHCRPGVTLISPPPHHDIYSIEDLAQLIYDLRQVNAGALISVKLASESGVGAISAGAAKAGAGAIIIAGCDGGTGASPLSSLKYAGVPWEIGLAETQQTLILNNLRGRVKLQVDGRMKTGRDVVAAALLGADEFGFATAPLVSLGCLMDRKCHTNACPVGLATQNPGLRARFKGRAEQVINFFRFIAREVREIMAGLGFRRLNELIGRVELLRPHSHSRLIEERGLDFSALLARPAGAERRFMGSPADLTAAASFDDRLLPQAAPAFEKGRAVVINRPVRNTDRAVGARLSARLAASAGGGSIADQTLVLNLTGAAGQSFGAFAARGLTLNLTGEANDYVGKGLSGGRLVIKAPPAAHPALRAAGRQTVCGNVALYGATSGEAFIGGLAGERFAVRNSGALAVVEGLGDHGCEYMTGGLVVVLGATGVNFGAGMSGGRAYVYDPDGAFSGRYNSELIDTAPLTPADENELFGLVQKHFSHTQSPAARQLIDAWKMEKTRFVKVVPREYRPVLEKEAGPPLKDSGRASRAA